MIKKNMIWNQIKFSSDSVENSVGGAMYISCGEDAVATESEMGYVPNNPLFGLPLDSPQVNFQQKSH